MSIFSKIFDGVGAYFRKMFKKAKAFAEKEIPAAIKVVEKIKDFMNSNAVPLITALIPGDVDDKIAARIIKELPGVLIKLQLSSECAKKGTADEVIQCAIAALNKYDPEAKIEKYKAIASMLSNALADGKIDSEERTHLIEHLYQTLIKKKK